jgi:WD40 repeat protein
LKLENEVEPITVQFSPDGRLLAVSYLSRIHFYDTKSWIENLNLGVVGEDNVRTDLKVTPAAPQLERRSAEQAQRDKNAPVPDLNESMRVWAYAKEKGDGRTRITDFSFDLDGDHITAAYCRGGCYASPGRRWSAFPTGSDPVRLWDIRGGRIVWELVYDKEGVTTRIVPSPDKRQFAIVNSHLGRCATGVYDLADGRVQWSHSLGPCGNPPSIRFCRDGQALITNRNDEGSRKSRAWRKMAIYAVKDGRKIADLPDNNGASALDITSGGRWLASTTWSEREFQIWDLETPKVVSEQVPREYKWKSSRLLDLVHFSPDERWLVVGSMTAGELVIYQTGLNP